MVPAAFLFAMVVFSVVYSVDGQLASDAFSGKLMDKHTIGGGREDAKGFVLSVVCSVYLHHLRFRLLLKSLQRAVRRGCKAYRRGYSIDCARLSFG
jgi:hypothetical protein